MAININNPRFARGASFSDAEKQRKLAHSTVLIAGCGAEGGSVAIQLARLGVGGFILADPGDLHAEDGNRYPHWFSQDNGQNKAEVVARIIRSIDPDIHVQTVKDGITNKNVRFLVARRDVDLVFDGIDIDQPEIDCKLNQLARENGKTVVMSIAIGRGGIVTVFDPNSRYTFERFSDAVGFIPHVPHYENFLKIKKHLEKGMKAPTTTTGTAVMTAMAADIVERILTQDPKRKIRFAPHYLVCDFGGNKPLLKWFRSPRRHVTASYIKALIWDKLGLVQEAGGYGDMM